MGIAPLEPELETFFFWEDKFGVVHRHPEYRRKDLAIFMQIL
jgi:hypothetical protein